MYFLLSGVMNFDHGRLGNLPQQSSKNTRVRDFTFRVNRHTEHPTQYHTSQYTETTHPSPKPWQSSQADHNYHDHEKTAPSEKSYSQTLLPNSTYPTNNLPNESVPPPPKNTKGT